MKALMKIKKNNEFVLVSEQIIKMVELIENELLLTFKGEKERDIFVKDAITAGCYSKPGDAINDAIFYEKELKLCSCK